MTVPGRITVIGLGLMGGSLARALAGAGRVAGWSPEAGEREALGEVGVHAPASLREALEGADGVVLATPLAAVRDLLSMVLEVAPEAWVTDVASLQLPPLRWARAAGMEERYATSHPMTGGEASGFAASRADLYRDAPVWVSTTPGCDPEVRTAVGGLWTGLGARPRDVDAERHDRRMACVSHLPQVVATHLAALLADRDVGPTELGPGGRDTTRLAGSDPRMWRDILALAGPAASEDLRDLARRLESEADRLARGDASTFAEILDRTRTWRRT